MRGYDINEAFCQDCEINIPCMGGLCPRGGANMAIYRKGSIKS